MSKTLAYFLPLKKEFYLKFKNGEQDCEIRPDNHRGWNSNNIYPGRLLKLSNGYGKHDRTTLEISNSIVTSDLKMENIPQWHIDAVVKIYGQQDSWLIAYVNN